MTKSGLGQGEVKFYHHCYIDNKHTAVSTKYMYTQ